MKSNFFVLVLTFVVGGIAGSWASLSVFSPDPSRKVDLAPPIGAEERKEVDGSGSPRVASLMESEELVLEERRSFDEKVELAMSYDSHRRRQYELERLFENLTASEAEGVLLDILEVKEPRLRGSLMRPFFVKWGEVDGPQAYAVALEMKGRDRNDGISAALAGWSHTDVHAAWKEALLIMEESTSPMNRLARGAVAEMAKQDPDALLSLLAEDSSNQKYSSFGYNLINQAFENGSQAQLLSRLGVIENGEDRNKLVSQLFQRWGTLDTGAPLDALDTIEDPAEAKSALEGFLKGWVESDREGALNYAFENQEDPAVQASFASMLQQSLHNGSRTENDALLTQLEERGLLSEVAQQIGPRIAFMQPEVGLRIAESIEDPKERNQQRQRSISGLARTDLDRARGYIEGIESVDDRAGLIPSVSWVLANRSDGGAQLVSLMESVPEGTARTKAIERVLAAASRPSIRMSDGYREGLALLVESESELSERAKESWAKVMAGQQ